MLKESDYLKIRTAVPVTHTEAVRQALGDAGAGIQGNYTHCSGSIPSLGRFIPGPGATPAVGEVNKPEEVREEIIEVLCHKDKVREVVEALKHAHPYEEPAIDILKRWEL